MLLKRIKKAPVLIFLLLLSCHDQDDTRVSQYDYLFIPNAWYMIADGTSMLHLAVFRIDRDGNREDVSTKTLFYHNGKELDGSTFTTLVTGEHRFKAVHPEWTSQEEIVISRPPKDYPLISIPVVFHVLYNNEPIGTGPNLSSDTITKLIQEVNDRYRNTYYKSRYPDMIKNPNHVDTRIEFRLAIYSPDGSLMEEPGVVRYEGIDATSSIWGEGNFAHCEHLTQVMWPPYHYINISVANKKYTSAANLPVSFANHQLCNTEVLWEEETWEEYLERNLSAGVTCKSHGVLLKSSHANSATLSHELAHILGLLHTFTMSEECEDELWPFGKYDCLEDTQFFNFNKLVEIGNRTMGFKDCVNDNWVIHDNYMGGNYYWYENPFLADYPETYFGFTYDQRDRMQEILEYSPWIKELKNSTK